MQATNIILNFLVVTFLIGEINFKHLTQYIQNTIHTQQSIFFKLLMNYYIYPFVIQSLENPMCILYLIALLKSDSPHFKCLIATHS